MSLHKKSKNDCFASTAHVKNVPQKLVFSPPAKTTRPTRLPALVALHRNSYPNVAPAQELISALVEALLYRYPEPPPTTPPHSRNEIRNKTVKKIPTGSMVTVPTVRVHTDTGREKHFQESARTLVLIESSHKTNVHHLLKAQEANRTIRAYVHRLLKGPTERYAPGALAFVFNGE